MDKALPRCTERAAASGPLLMRALQIEDRDTAALFDGLLAARIYEKGETLLRQGEIWKQAFLIEQGLVRMHVVRGDGKEFNKNFHAEGALIFPLTHEMESQASLFAISALERTVAWQARVEDFRTALSAQGMWEPLRARLLAGLVTQKLQREHDLLVLDGGARYRQLCASQPSLAARIPLFQLASFLGLTDVSLSRIRRRIKAGR